MTLWQWLRWIITGLLLGYFWVLVAAVLWAAGLVLLFLAGGFALRFPGASEAGMLIGFIASFGGCFVGGVVGAWCLPAQQGPRRDVYNGSGNGAFFGAITGIGLGFAVGCIVGRGSAGVWIAVSVLSGGIGGWLGSSLARRQFPRDSFTTPSDKTIGNMPDTRFREES